MASRLIDVLLVQAETKFVSRILTTIKYLNRLGYAAMFRPYRTFAEKYRSLQQTETWRRGKRLVELYFLKTRDGPLVCHHCGEPIHGGGNRAHLHHAEYDEGELFTPGKAVLVHPRCHRRIHAIQGPGH